MGLAHVGWVGAVLRFGPDGSLRDYLELHTKGPKRSVRRTPGWRAYITTAAGPAHWEGSCFSRGGVAGLRHPCLNRAEQPDARAGEVRVAEAASDRDASERAGGRSPSPGQGHTIVPALAARP